MITIPIAIASFIVKATLPIIGAMLIAHYGAALADALGLTK